MKHTWRALIQIIWNFIVFLWNYCWDTPYLRFLNVGFVNLVFMLGIGVLLDFMFKTILPTFFIALLVSIFHVSFSFVTRKIFVYRTKGDWLNEYLRCYAFYGVSIVISVLVLWLFIDQFKFAFWSAQLWSLFIATLFYSLTSRYFAFMRISKHKETAMIEGHGKGGDSKQSNNDSHAHSSINDIDTDKSDSDNNSAKNIK